LLAAKSYVEEGLTRRGRPAAADLAWAFSESVVRSPNWGPTMTAAGGGLLIPPWRLARSIATARITLTTPADVLTQSLRVAASSSQSMRLWMRQLGVTIKSDLLDEAAPAGPRVAACVSEVVPEMGQDRESREESEDVGGERRTVWPPFATTHNGPKPFT